MLKRTHVFIAMQSTTHIIELLPREYIEKITYHPEAEGQIELEIRDYTGDHLEAKITNNDQDFPHTLTLWIHEA